MQDALARMLDFHRAARHCPGAVVLVERDGAELARLVSGALHGEAPGDAAGEPMRADALFRIASLTKPVVSFLAMILVDEERLGLDDPVARHLPELAAMRLPDGAAPARQPTIRDLLRHTSGFAYGREIAEADVAERILAEGLDERLPLLEPAAVLASLARLPLARQPGTAFRYGYSTDVLGLVIGRILGQRLGDALAERIFGPLGMRETGFAVPSQQRERMPTAFPEDRSWHGLSGKYVQADELGTPMHSGGGGLASTIDDYARFARLLANGGVHEGRRLLSETGFAEMARDQLPRGVDGPLGFTGPGFGFGLGLAVRRAGGAAAYPCAVGELTWSGMTGTALFVDPATRWFALLFSCNTVSRLIARFEFRRALG
ncbi:MAG: serine hydrolase domain-containing protein [Burkholderiaceae bacterium]